MAVEYDLAVIGATAAAQAGAIAAAQSHARVAWVAETPPVNDPLMLLREGSALSLWGQPSPQSGASTMEMLESALEQTSSPAAVQAYGVHYIEGPIWFDPAGLMAGGRLVRSRAYLLAVEPPESRPPGLDHAKVWTVAQLSKKLQAGERFGLQSIGVLGRGPQAIELSQSLRRLGLSVLLLTNGKALLPQEDEEAAFLLQAHLEGSGVEIDKEVLTAIQDANDRLMLEMGDRKHITDGLVIASEATGSLPSTLTPLSLRQTPQGIWVNRALQTSNPFIYACGSLLGGYRIPSLARYEAKLAVQNALFETRLPLHYHQVPYAILSDPPLARVGLTERQALQYDPQTQVIRQTYKDCDRAVFAQAPAGLCKVLVQPNGTLLGAHLIGADAPEIIHLFALAIQQGIRLQALGALGYVSPTFSQVIQTVAEAWQQQGNGRDRNERWFYNRRKQTH